MHHSKLQLIQIELFTNYVHDQFERQGIRRKYTGESYVNHCIEVVEILKSFGLNDFISTIIALGHDLLEDIDNLTTKDILEFLNKIRVKGSDSTEIVFGIVELTNKFTSKEYPSLNRKARKTKEAERLGNMSARIQTIKYGDLISNTKSIVEHDEKFARIYLEEKQQLLNLLTKGDGLLYHLAKNTLYESLFKISETNKDSV